VRQRPGNGRLIAVIGGRKAPKALLREAEAVGRLIAESGGVLVTGGLGGVMEAASRGAKGAGGLTVGILPHEHAKNANPYVDIPVATGLGIGRNVIIARTAEALVALGGEYGTLSEIAFALQMGKPVAGIGTWAIKGVTEAGNASDAVGKILSILEDSPSL
jgi:uncharacterized protein (TIGR00725 family)